MNNNIKPIVPGFGTSLQVHLRGDLLGFLAHAVKMTLRAGMFTPMAKVSVANRIFLR